MKESMVYQSWLRNKEVMMKKALCNLLTKTPMKVFFLNPIFYFTQVGGNEDDELFDQMNDSMTSSDEEVENRKKRIFRISIKANSILKFKLVFGP